MIELLVGMLLITAGIMVWYFIARRNGTYPGCEKDSD